MFNVGGGEIIVIAFIALLVLGPQRLPDAARQAGRAMAELRRFSSGFQNELRAALDETPDTPTEVPRRVVEAVSEVAESADEPPVDAQPAADAQPADSPNPESSTPDAPAGGVPDPAAVAPAGDMTAAPGAPGQPPGTASPRRPRRTRPLTAGDGTA